MMTKEINKFWSRVSKEDGCWNWIAATTPWGYGKMYIGGKLEGAHRISYKLYYGPIPEGMCVCHTCDNPPCVNPSHLFIGTHKTNAEDKINKGRDFSYYRGATHCVRGHEFNESNTYRYKGARQCKKCVRMHQQKKIT